ncbi:hypothetical protein F5B21DRAFT_145508 [Xylaria acuta]|nr:hypothetical protein F5B21DRAFT_145508 [Xylaria acuta]
MASLWLFRWATGWTTQWINACGWLVGCFRYAACNSLVVITLATTHNASNSVDKFARNRRMWQGFDATLEMAANSQMPPLFQTRKLSRRMARWGIKRSVLYKQDNIGSLMQSCRGKPLGVPPLW